MFFNVYDTAIANFSQFLLHYIHFDHSKGPYK